MQLLEVSRTELPSGAAYKSVKIYAIDLTSKGLTFCGILERCNGAVRLNCENGSVRDVCSLPDYYKFFIESQ